MRALRLPLLLGGLVLGLGAEWASYSSQLGLGFAARDLVVGLLLVACGVTAWDRRPASRVGPLMLVAGAAWFLGNFAAPLLYLHRGPLVHLHLSYPTGRLPTRLAKAVVGAAYADALIEPIARNDVLTLVLSALVALTAAQVFLGTSGPARKAGGPALIAALAFAGVLALGAAERLSSWDGDSVVLWAYQVVIAAIAVSLLVDLLRAKWSDAVVTGLVVDLGELGETGTLRDKLARALGDRSLELGYWLPEAGTYVDESGAPLELPAGETDRVVTPIGHGGERVAVLVHDRAVLADTRLVESVAAAARIAVANVRLQAEVRASIAELEASRRRIVEAGDAQRRNLELELREGAERRLEAVAGLLADAQDQAGDGCGQVISGLREELVAARLELRELARGIHPAALTEGGLAAALAELAERLPVPVELRGSAGRFPAPTEAAVYFVCSEALANVVKHANATSVTIELSDSDGRLLVRVADDGVGGADAGRGSGLRGLRDRIEALGGSLAVESAPGRGTRLTAVLGRG